MVFELLDLVDELVLSILEEIDSAQDLRSLARTCSPLQALSEPLLYRDIALHSRRDALTLASSIVSRPSRLQAIRKIDVRYRYVTRDCRLDVLVDIIWKARNLQELTVESPFCNHVQSYARYGWLENMNALLRPICDFSIPRLTTRMLN